MSHSQHALAAFKFDRTPGWWQAELHVPLWGGPLAVRIDAPAEGPSPWQAQRLQAILAYPQDLRGAVARALLAHYRDEWAGVTPSLGQGPELTEPEEVWPYVSNVSLFIPAGGGTVPVFEVHLDSKWDEDHGLCVIVRDWGSCASPGKRTVEAPRPEQPTLLLRKEFAEKIIGEKTGKGYKEKL